MTWKLTAAAALPPVGLADDQTAVEDWTSLLDAIPDLPAESREERLERLRDLSTATLSLTVSGDVEDTVTVDLPCEVAEERPGVILRLEGRDEPVVWVIARVESVEPVKLGFTQLTSFSIALPGYVGPGFYPLDEVYRRAQADEVEWWQVDDFHLSPTPVGDSSTFYLDSDAIDGAWVATTGVSIAFDLPMASVASEIRVTGTLSWNDPGDRPGALAKDTDPR